MLFNSLQFLIFLPIVFFINFLIPTRYRLYFLLLASCIFYLVGTPFFIAVIFLSIIIDYCSARILVTKKGKVRKIIFLVSLLVNIGLLAFFKYFNFFENNTGIIASFFGLKFNPFLLNVALPLGLSFHTFQGMSYVIEVYKKRYKPEKNIFRYALFVMFFPQLVAGPIERPQQLLKQLHKVHSFNYENTKNGMQLMLFGMFKKVVVADRIAVFINPIFISPKDSNGISLVVSIILFAIQIYYDFSGYTDIARGAALIFGYKLEINFNSPYSSRSIQDFWRRWHISLSYWFRDYVYIPLGGSRGSLLKTCLIVIITFFLVGLWHGASWHYVMWGVLNGVYLALFNVSKNITYLKKIKVPTRVSILFTFFLVCTTWIFFRANSISDSFLIFQKVFFDLVPHINGLELIKSVFLGQNKAEFLIVVLLTCLIEFSVLRKSKLIPFFERQPMLLRWAIYTFVVWTIILAGKFGTTTFIYFSF